MIYKNQATITIFWQTFIYLLVYTYIYIYLWYTGLHFPGSSAGGYCATRDQDPQIYIHIHLYLGYTGLPILGSRAGGYCATRDQDPQMYIYTPLSRIYRTPYSWIKNRVHTMQLGIRIPKYINTSLSRI